MASPCRFSGVRLRVTASALVALLLALVGLALPAQAHAAAAKLPMFGVQFHGTWAGYTDAAKRHVLHNLALAGVETVRIDVSWAMLEPDGPGQMSQWGVDQVDSAIRLAVDHGLSPLVTFWMAPEWANGSTDERVPPTSPEGLAGLRSITERLAAEYAGVVDAWEVWNEPNSDDFMRGADPQAYAELLAASYAGYKAGNPNSQVVFGGPSYVDSDWVAQVLDAGGAANFDVMAVHPYMGVADEPPELPDDGTMWRLNRLPTLLELMAEYGVGDREVWFTEFGWSVNTNGENAENWQRGVLPAEQADYLERTVDLVRSDYPQVTRLYWYQDRADSNDPLNTGYGLLRPDGEGTPALLRIAARYAPETDPATIGKPLAPIEAAESIAQQEANPVKKKSKRLPLPKPPPPPLVALVPVRVADTRVGQPVGFPAVKVPVGAGQVLEVPVGGVGQVPVDAAAVVANVTVTGAVSPGHVRVFPCGQVVPNASTLNYPAGVSVANGTVVGLGSQGKVCVYSASQAHVLVDVGGYFPAGAGYRALVPVRVADTRVGQPVGFPAVKVPVGAGQVLEVPVGGVGQVPVDAAAVVANVTVTGAVSPGHVRVFPCGQVVPNASTLNYPAGVSVANGTVVGLGSQGKVCVYSASQAHVLVDVGGYFPAG